MKKDRTFSAAFFYSIGIFALFLAGFLMLVLFGARSYRAAAETQESASRFRALTSYLSAAAAGSGGAYKDTWEGGDLLVIPDGDSGYGLLVFRTDEGLSEQYCQLSGAPDPAASRVIAETAAFSVSQPSPRLLAVQTDAGTVFLPVWAARRE